VIKSSSSSQHGPGDPHELAGERHHCMVGAAARFHRDNAGWQLTNKGDQGVPPNTPAQNYCAGFIESDHTAHVLPDIDSKHRNPIALSSH
jgi:hypothetical protein